MEHTPDPRYSIAENAFHDGSAGTRSGLQHNSGNSFDINFTGAAAPSFHGSYVQIPAEKWRSLAAATALPLNDEDVRRLAALGDPIDIAEADAVYRPLSALMQMYAKSTRKLLHESTEFIGFPEARTPWIIGIAGSVAVGKSTAARLLRELMSRWPQTPNVDLITTDGFLYPNAKLEALGIMHRKGFPESYDRYALLNFLDDVKSGKPNLKVPVYDHVTYDIVPDQFITVNQPQILIVEGLNVLQPPRMSSADGEFRAVSDYFDFSIYLDAAEENLETWYLNRMLALKKAHSQTRALSSENMRIFRKQKCWRWDAKFGVR
ncbi:type I pantothenate kinase [Arcanobacterium hippocoleae]